jgi:DnaJ-class molecular chaperone
MKQDNTLIRVVKIAALLAVMLAMGRIIATPDTQNAKPGPQCPACGGSGRQSFGFGFQTTPGMCPQCGGAGRD